MKKQFNILLGVVFTTMFLVGMSSCKKEDNIKHNENDPLARYLELKSALSSFQKNYGNANLEALGASILSNKKKSLKDDVDSGWVDTTYWENWTCAEVSEYIDNDGNNVTVYDYGVAGCDDWGSLIKGKITYIWSQQDDIYYSKVIYENYYAYGLLMNGYSEYSYTFDNMFFENNEDSTVYSINWSGSSSCKDDLQMLYDSGESFIYQSNYSSEWNENSYTVHQGEYLYKDMTNEYEYSYIISQELFYNYECGWEIWIPVKGVEEINYKDSEQNIEFVTNYGDGTCDNLAIVTENGVSYTVDFGNLWYWEPCEGENCDSVIVMVD